MSGIIQIVDATFPEERTHGTALFPRIVFCHAPNAMLKRCIYKLAEADFKAVAELAATIWREHYSKIISIEQIDYMLAGRFSDENLRSYLNSSERWFEVLGLGEKAVGYCSYSLASAAGEMKLEQLYLLQEYRGRKLGRFMLHHVEAEARKRGAKSLMLQVNKRNENSIAFYRKAGFQVREAAVFDIGNGYFMDDYVMEKKL